MADTPSDTMLFELKITGVLAGQYVANVMHFVGPLDFTAIIEDEDGLHISYDYLVDALNTLNDESGGFLGLYLATVPADYKMNSMQLRCVGINAGELGTTLLGSNAAIVSGADLGARDGLRTGSIQVQNVSPGISFITAEPRRIGKVFLPGLSETDADDGVLTSGFIAAANDFADFCVSGALEINTEEWKAGVYARASLLQEAGWLRAFDFRLGLKIWTQKKRRIPI
jgi:hypothetical protein